MHQSIYEYAGSFLGKWQSKDTSDIEAEGSRPFVALHKVSCL